MYRRRRETKQNDKDIWKECETKVYDVKIPTVGAFEMVPLGGQVIHTDHSFWSRPNFFFFFFSNKKSPKKIFKKVTVTAKGENLALAKPSPSSFDCWVNLKNKQQLVTGLYFFWCFQMFSFCRSPSGLFGV